MGGSSLKSGGGPWGSQNQGEGGTINITNNNNINYNQIYQNQNFGKGVTAISSDGVVPTF
jgi:hypothetical protein